MRRSNRTRPAALLMSAQLFLLPVVQAQDATPPAAPPPAAPAAPPPAAPAAPAAPAYSAAQLDDLVSPIALYPDSLVAQILMASTYPLEVVQADRWREGQKDLKGDALAKALEQQQWDPSVEALTHFPDLLARMSKNLDWTQELGNAFLAQQADVMDAIQRMRKAAYDAGALKSSEQQKVTVQPSTSAPQQQIITVQPADPQVVYVPQYPPTAYGSSYAPSPYSTGMYPPPSAYPPGYNATTNLLSFGVGIALGGLIWGGDDDCDWNGHSVYGGGRNVNVSTGDITVNKGNRQAWQHNPAHRGGVGYKDPGTRQRYASAAQPRGDTRQARGFDRAPDDRRASAGPARGSPPARETRPEARPAPAKRPAEAQRPAPKRAAQQPAARPAPARQREQAFGGMQQGGFERQASARGAASRAPTASARGGGGRPSGGGGGRPAGGGGARGGGGGGGRGGRGR